MHEYSVPKKHTHILCLATAVLLILLFCSHYPAGLRTELDDHLSGGKHSVLSSGAQVSPEIVTSGERSDASHHGRLTGASDRHSESVRPLRLFILICAVVFMRFMMCSRRSRISGKTAVCSHRFIIHYIHNIDGKKD